MASWTLTNLLSVANMTISGATRSGDVFTYPAGVFCMITQPLPVPVAGHKYYGRVDQKVPEGATFGDGRFEYFGGDGEGKNITFTSFWNALQDNQWHTYSDILNFPYVTGENWTLRSFTVDGSQTVYRQRHMIIDLTESFGAGNEPSKDWCDRCIPFFEGSKTIESKPLVGMNGIAMILTGGYVGVGEIARKIITGYVGVNDSAKRIWDEAISIPRPIGGRIFYDDGNNGAVYHFFDANGNEISDTSIAGLANAASYTVKGRPTKDRWYVYDDSLAGHHYWGYYGTSLGCADGIGLGKVNTTIALSRGVPTDYTPNIWSYIKSLRDSNKNGCNDWYIGTASEQSKLDASNLVPWYDDYSIVGIWGSNESIDASHAPNYARSWYDTSTGTSPKYRWADRIKNYTAHCFGMRSF